VAAFDAEIIDPFGEIEDVVALEAEIVKSILPLAAGVEMADFPFVPSFADLNVPGAQARALETGTQHHAILVQTAGFVCDDGAAPIQFGDGAPGIPMADAFFLLRNGIDAWLQRLPPAQAGFNKHRFIVYLRPLGTPDNDGLQLLGAHHCAQTVSCRVVVVVDEHGSANEVLARWADGADARVLMTRLRTQHRFGVAHAFAPDAAGVAQFYFVFADIKIGWFQCRAGDDDTIITGGFY